MLDTLRAWLNGTREYNTGVSLYDLLGTDTKLKALFKQGYTLWNNYRLQEELKAICDTLKKKQAKELIAKSTKLKNVRNSVPAFSKEFHELEKPIKEVDQLLANITDIASTIAKHVSPPNPELYAASKLEADKIYKAAMNKRAVLFSMIPSDKYSQHNTPDLMEARRKLCLEVVSGYNHASELYDQADHVKLFGELPDQDDPGIEEEVANLPDFEVKPALDNARKALNKLKGRDQTAERVVLIQNHQLRIKKLEERWHSLKPQK